MINGRVEALIIRVMMSVIGQTTRLGDDGVELQRPLGGGKEFAEHLVSGSSHLVDWSIHSTVHSLVHWSIHSFVQSPIHLSRIRSTQIKAEDESGRSTTRGAANVQALSPPGGIKDFMIPRVRVSSAFGPLVGSLSLVHSLAHSTILWSNGPMNAPSIGPSDHSSVHS